MAMGVGRCYALLGHETLLQLQGMLRRLGELEEAQAALRGRGDGKKRSPVDDRMLERDLKSVGAKVRQSYVVLRFQHTPFADHCACHMRRASI